MCSCHYEIGLTVKLGWIGYTLTSYKQIHFQRCGPAGSQNEVIYKTKPIFSLLTESINGEWRVFPDSGT